MKPHVEKRPLPADASFLCVVRDEKSFDFNWHVHARHELVLILEGHGQRFVGDHIGQYRKNDLVLAGANLPHSWVSSKTGSSPRNRAVYIQFSHDFLGPHFLDAPELKHVAGLLKHAQRGLLFHMAQEKPFTSEFIKIPELTGLARLRKFLEILETLSHLEHEAEQLSSAAFTQPSLEKNSHRAQIMLEYVHRNILKELSVTDVAGKINMSKSTFCRFFKRVTGKSLVEYINDVRVGNACLLLSETELSVSEICFASGFASLPYFNRRFLATKGITPTAYRRAM